MRNTKHLIVWTLFCALACSGAYADDPPAPLRPKAIICDSFGNPPPEEVQAGEALYLSAAQSVAGEKPNSIVWIIKPKARAERSKVYGREVCIPLGMKECELQVTQIAALGDEASFAEITIKIKGEKPGPDPDPDPDPIPVPVIGMTKIVTDNLKPIVAKHTKVADTIALAATSAAYTQAVQEVKDGKITTIDQLLDRTKALTHTALGARYPDLWEPVVRKVELELQRLGDAGKLPDLKSHIPLWEEVAKGINTAIGV